MREDILEAYKLLDGSGRSAIDGMRASGPIKKAYQQLEEFLPDERVLALATGFDQPLSMSEKRSMSAGQGLKAISDQAKSGRLLVLTERNFYEVIGTGRLNGNRPQGIRIALAAVQDVRTRSNRTLTRKERLLMIDHMRGAQLETEVYSVSTDNELAVFPPLLSQQVALIGEMIDEQERQKQAPVVVQSQVSVADELSKLAQLRDAGVLDDDEFAQQKAKLLG